MGGFTDPNPGSILNVCSGTITALLRQGFIEPVYSGTGEDALPVPGAYTPTARGRVVLGKMLGEPTKAVSHE